MRKKYTVVAFSLLLIMVIEILIYKKHEVADKTRLLRCYPTGAMYPYKDANEKIISDSVFHTIADFKLTD